MSEAGEGKSIEGISSTAQAKEVDAPGQASYWKQWIAADPLCLELDPITSVGEIQLTGHRLRTTALDELGNKMETRKKEQKSVDFSP